ncbi:unnamed protein product, partial [Prorocentrum cordatum]
AASGFQPGAVQSPTSTAGPSADSAAHGGSTAGEQATTDGSTPGHAAGDEERAAVLAELGVDIADYPDDYDDPQSSAVIRGSSRRASKDSQSSAVIRGGSGGSRLGSRMLELSGFPHGGLAAADALTVGSVSRAADAEIWSRLHQQLASLQKNVQSLGRRLDVMQRRMLRRMVGWISRSDDTWEDHSRRVKLKLNAALNNCLLYGWSHVVRDRNSTFIWQLPSWPTLARQAAEWLPRDCSDLN